MFAISFVIQCLIITSIVGKNVGETENYNLLFMPMITVITYVIVILMIIRDSERFQEILIDQISKTEDNIV